MAFKIILSDEARWQLKKLDNAAASQVLAKLEESKDDPTHFFRRLAGREEYKLRAGDYRVIANILLKEQTIFITSLGHRKNIYEKI